jgi:hypothetical protein
MERKNNLCFDSFGKKVKKKTYSNRIRLKNKSKNCNRMPSRMERKTNQILISVIEEKTFIIQV